MNHVGQDLLLLIFLQLPDCRSAIRCGAVSKLWYFLISDRRFVCSFIRRQKAPSPNSVCIPYTLLIDFSKGGSNNPCIIFRRIWHPPSTTTPSLSYTNSLKFSSRSFTVRAFFNDILLVSDRSHPCTTYYICNPLTRKFVALPDAPQRCTIFFQIPLDSIMVGLDWYGMHNRRAMLRLQSSSYHYSQRFQSIRFNLSFLLWLQNGRCSWFLLPSGSILIFEPSIFRWLCLPMGCYSG